MLKKSHYTVSLFFLIYLYFLSRWIKSFSPSRFTLRFPQKNHNSTFFLFIRTERFKSGSLRNEAAHIFLRFVIVFFQPSYSFSFMKRMNIRRHFFNHHACAFSKNFPRPSFPARNSLSLSNEGFSA